MGAYRQNLEAAVSRIDVLEAQLTETRALLDARDAALHAREAELRALERERERDHETKDTHETNEIDPDRATPRLSLGLMTVGAAALLLSLGLSEAFDRADRAEARYVEARDRLEAERRESEQALDALRLETSRLEQIVDTLDEEDLAAPSDTTEALDALAADETATDARIAELVASAREGEADANDLRLLRALCRKEGHEACYRFSVERLRSERALGF